MNNDENNNLNNDFNNTNPYQDFDNPYQNNSIYSGSNNPYPDVQQQDNASMNSQESNDFKADSQGQDFASVPPQNGYSNNNLSSNVIRNPILSQTLPGNNVENSIPNYSDNSIPNYIPNDSANSMPNNSDNNAYDDILPGIDPSVSTSFDELYNNPNQSFQQDQIQNMQQDNSQMQGQDQYQSQDVSQSYNQYQNQNNPQVQEQNNWQYNQYQSSNNSDYNIEFVKNWMGNLYEKTHSKKFNWCSALFGPAYFLYRKMYSTGTLLFLLLLILELIVFVLGVKNVTLLLILGIIVPIIFFFATGFGFYPLYRNFVRGKLNKYKQTITDNNQLLSLASQKGGVSAIALVIYIVGVPIISSILLGILTSVGLLKISLNMFSKPTSSINNNQIQEPVIDTEDYNFYEDYYITYDANTWFLDETKSALVKGDYSLSYKGQYPGSAFNTDMSVATGRSTILQLFTNSFNAQAAHANLQVEPGSSNFVPEGDCYYAYIDIVAANSITRYYFVLLPNDNILFQFVLEINDTSIDYTTNLSVINILTSIFQDSLDLESQGNSTENSISNDNSINSINSNNTVVSNNVESVLSNNTVSSNISTLTNNTIADNSTISDNTTSSANSVVSSNSTLGGTSSTTLSGMLAQ